MLKRTYNEGMDFAAHNTSMTYAMTGLKSFWLSYRYYMFLNSSVKGPLLPKYFTGHWTDPFTSLIRGKVKAVGSSIACLPDIDAGTPLPLVLLLCSASHLVHDVYGASGTQMYFG